MKNKIFFLLTLFCVGTNNLMASGTHSSAKKILPTEFTQIESNKGHFCLSARKTALNSMDITNICDFGIAYQTAIKKDAFFQSKLFGVEFIPFPSNLFYKINFTGMHYWNLNKSYRWYSGCGVSCIANLNPFEVISYPVPILLSGIELGKSNGIIHKFEIDFNTFYAFIGLYLGNHHGFGFSIAYSIGF